MKRLLVLVLLSGCVGSEPRASAGWSVETLPNGAIRVTNSGAGSWGSGGGWRLEPELVLGEIEGAREVLFGFIAGVEADDEGRIYVLDGQANELRIFAPDGTHLRTAGGSGQGPGEHTAANGLLWMNGDTLIVVDQRGRRYSVLTRDGEYVRSVPRPLGFFQWAFAGSYHDGQIYEQALTGGPYPDLTPVLIALDVRRTTDSPSGAPGTTATPDVARQDTVVLPLSGGSPLPENFLMLDDQGRAVGFMEVPFSPGAVYHLDRGGSLWHGHGSEFRIVRSTLAGDTLMEVTADIAAEPVRPEELETWRAQDHVETWIARAGPIDMTRIPEAKPFFDELYVDPDGYLWVAVPAGPAEAIFEVFDPEGRYLGPVRASGFERLSWIPPVVRAGRLYLAGRDELDVERVFVFRIQR